MKKMILLLSMIFLALVVGGLVSAVGVTCTDSDGGYAPSVNGITTGPAVNGQIITEEDKCMIKLENGDYHDVTSCSGTNCLVTESYCDNSTYGRFVISTSAMGIPCTRGCTNGACSDLSCNLDSDCLKTTGGKYCNGTLQSCERQTIFPCVNGKCSKGTNSIICTSCPQGNICSDGDCVANETQCYSDSDCPKLNGTQFCKNEKELCNPTFSYSCENNMCISIGGSGSDCKVCPNGCEDGACIAHVEVEPVCQNLYWFDNDNQECGQKEFCQLYMYSGLRTFETKEECDEAVNEPVNKIKGQKNMSFLPWQKINDSECLEGCKCVGAVMSCTREDGKTMTIEAGRSGNIITITVDRKEANTTLEIESETDNNNKTKIKTNLSNGRKAEIKIMPETASATAIARLGELGFTIELKEVGKGNNAKPVYELTGNKHGKFLGIFKIMASEKVQVDAETGEIVKIKKQWWSFLASGI